MTLDGCRLGIVGVGLMGGSLGLALSGKCRERIGFDRSDESIRLAIDLGAVDGAASSLGDLVRGIDLLVLATPVGSILEILGRLETLTDSPLTLVDLGSTKSEVVEAMSRLPARFDPVGGHPMCGKETSGIEAATGDLFRGRLFVLTPLERTARESRELVIELVEAVGARPVVLDPATHDRFAAAISHGPYVVSAAIAEAARREEGGAGILAASGFRDTTRVAASNPEVMVDALLSNRAAVLDAISRVEDVLRELTHGIRSGDRDELRGKLEEVRSWRQRLFPAESPKR